MMEMADVVAGYGKVEVLHGISLKVPAGKLITLIGSNGAGKTTTLRAISGMIAPPSGQISLGGLAIAGLASHQITRKGVAHSPEGRRVFPSLSVVAKPLQRTFPRLTGGRKRGDVKGDPHRVFGLFPRLGERRAHLPGTPSV